MCYVHMCNYVCIILYEYMYVYSVYNVYVCVCTVWIDVKLRPYIIWCYIFIYGRGQRDLQLWPLPTKLHTGDQVNVPALSRPGRI